MFDNIDEIECLKAVEKFLTAEGEIDMDLLSRSDLDPDFKDQLFKCYLQSCEEKEALNQELRELNEQKLAAEKRVNKVRVEAIEQKIYADRLEEELAELEQKENLIRNLMDTAENVSIVNVSCRRLKQLQNFYIPKRFDTLYGRIITKTEHETTQNLPRPSSSSPSLTPTNASENLKGVKEVSSAVDLTNSSDFGPALKLEFKEKSEGVAVYIQHNIDKGRREKAQKQTKETSQNKVGKRKDKGLSVSCETKIIFTTFPRGEVKNAGNEKKSNSQRGLHISQKRPNFSQSDSGTDRVTMTRRHVPESVSDPGPGSISVKKHK